VQGLKVEMKYRKAENEKWCCIPEENRAVVCQEEMQMDGWIWVIPEGTSQALLMREDLILTAKKQKRREHY
jgi:hypothetical protein